jgi:hypothetical protein
MKNYVFISMVDFCQALFHYDGPTCPKGLMMSTEEKHTKISSHAMCEEQLSPRNPFLLFYY